jgi:hypothetical protein
MRMGSFCRGAAALSVAVSIAGCKSQPTPSPESAAPSAAAAPNASAPPSSTLVPGPRVWVMATGPKLEILPGAGVGPIRIGATVATIERLMDLPCQQKTETMCGYSGRGVEFYLKDGVTVEIRAYRPVRPKLPAGTTYGVFNGAMRNGVAFDMLLPAVRELLGPPLKVTPVTDGGEAHTVEVDDYKGMRIEFDRKDNGYIVVGMIDISRPSS